jgi:hypothetical protein
MLGADGKARSICAAPVGNLGVLLRLWRVPAAVGLAPTVAGAATSDPRLPAGPTSSNVARSPPRGGIPLSRGATLGATRSCKVRGTLAVRHFLLIWADAFGQRDLGDILVLLGSFFCVVSVRASPAVCAPHGRIWR